MRGSADSASLFLAEFGALLRTSEFLKISNDDHGPPFSG
jgi:hypothetical protein